MMRRRKRNRRHKDPGSASTAIADTSKRTSRGAAATSTNSSSSAAAANNKKISKPQTYATGDRSAHNKTGDKITAEPDEKRKADEEHKLRLTDYSFCEICGKKFYDPELENFTSDFWSVATSVDPLQREEDYLVHFMADHMLDELKEGRFTLEEVEDLAAYLEITKKERHRLVLALSDEDRSGDEILMNSYAHHLKLHRVDLCFITFIILLSVWIAYEVRYGAENSSIGWFARQFSVSILSLVGNGIKKGATSLGLSGDGGGD